MVVNCTTFFLFYLIVFIVIDILLSRKKSIGILVSIIVGFVFTIILYYLNSSQILVLNSLIEKIYLSLSKINMEIGADMRYQFGLSIILIIIFLIAFSLSLIIYNLLIKKIKKNFPKNRVYYFSKYVIVTINSIMAIINISFFITTLNLIYNMDKGFLSFIFELMEKGIHHL